MNEFDIIKEKKTNGANYDLSSEDIINKLIDWNSKYGVSISHVDHNRFEISFTTLPDNLEALAQDIYSFCPDIIEQGYGCLDEMIEMFEESEQLIPDSIKEQIEGVDLNDDGYGLKVLQNVMSKDKKLVLWWD
ncbi:DUF4253 domain-containing protein [Pleionea litopenaei]|uniref:DUF4253 domain-containing protein n=1 Tax=Pleionea litopenaei TaxID=3070815 RepID=A0AA51RVJ7_9GAMM|nr:DUF4253 domain-containing protein [Pleionea sp. HL-JVS1]WMS88294.1 DUF4253 domain-containing protein [Pleionea sp. HL-JVS1]